MGRLDLDLLLSGCRDDALDGGVSIRATLEPLAGDGAPVKPPTYAPASGQEGPQLQWDRRWRDRDGGREPVDAIVLDNVPSQANRVEGALARAAGELGLPELALDLSTVGELPPHVPDRLSSFVFPHRNADAYLRDAVLDGEAFPRSEVGAALFAATARDPAALLRWFPQALVFGFWQSHLGKRGSQAKLARSWTSEIVGYEPATDKEVRQLGLKGDPLNLAKGEKVYVDREDATRWGLGKGPKGTRTTKLSELGHGQVPVSGDEAAPAGVSFATIEQRTTLSLAGLRRIWAGGGEANAAARALVAALALLGHVRAFAGAFTLRSGADLRTTGATWTWIGATEDLALDPLGVEDAHGLFDRVVTAAEEVGLPVGSRWDPRQLTLTPNEQLARSIRSTYPRADA